MWAAAVAAQLSVAVVAGLSAVAVVARLSAVAAEALEAAALWAPAEVRQSAQVAVLEVAAPA